MVPCFAPWWSIATAGNVEQAGSVLRDLEPYELRAALVDLQLPDGDGIELLKLVRQRFPEAYPVLFTSMLDRNAFTQCAKLEAEFLMKDDAAETLHRLAERLLHTQGDLEFELLVGIRELADATRLTMRERQIVTLAALDVQRHDMLARLRVRPDTLKTHVRAILQKTGETQLADVAEDLRRTARRRRAAVRTTTSFRRGVSSVD